VFIFGIFFDSVPNLPSTFSIGWILYCRPKLLDLNARLRDRCEQHFARDGSNWTDDGVKLNHWHVPAHARMSLGQGWDFDVLPAGIKYYASEKDMWWNWGLSDSQPDDMSVAEYADWWAEEQKKRIPDLAGQMSIPLPFDTYQPAFQYFYNDYDDYDMMDCYLLDADCEQLPTHFYFGLWLKDMDEFLPGVDAELRTESLENLLQAHHSV
jgi:hypothetical protein